MFFKRYDLYFAWILSCLGFLGSLYFSEVRHMEPCTLCWYQRIALFPLPLILGIGTYEGNRNVIRYCLPLTLIGLFFSLYQVAIQEFPGMNLIELCGSGPSCSDKIKIGLGPITIPMLSAANFLSISSILIASWYKHTQEALHKQLIQ